MSRSEQQEDLDRLLKEYETSSNGTQWPKYTRETGCSRSALKRCFIISFIGLVAVSVGWFLHVNVFMDKPAAPVDTQKAILAGFTDVSKDSGGLMSLVTKSGIFNQFNMTAILDYVMKHIPPALAARVISHIDDVRKGNFLTVFQDAQLIDGILDFLEVPEDFPGFPKPKKPVADYDYDDDHETKKQNETKGNALDKSGIGDLGKFFGFGKKKENAENPKTVELKKKLQDLQKKFEQKKQEAELGQEKQRLLNRYNILQGFTPQQINRQRHPGYGPQFDAQDQGVLYPLDRYYKQYGRGNIGQEYENQDLAMQYQQLPQQLPFNQKLSQPLYVQYGYGQSGRPIQQQSLSQQPQNLAQRLGQFFGQFFGQQFQSKVPKIQMQQPNQQPQLALQKQFQAQQPSLGQQLLLQQPNQQAQFPLYQQPPLQQQQQPFKQQLPWQQVSTKQKQPELLLYQRPPLQQHSSGQQFQQILTGQHLPLQQPPTIHKEQVQLPLQQQPSGQQFQQRLTGQQLPLQQTPTIQLQQQSSLQQNPALQQQPSGQQFQSQQPQQTPLAPQQSFSGQQSQQQQLSTTQKQETNQQPQPVQSQQNPIEHLKDYVQSFESEDKIQEILNNSTTTNNTLQQTTSQSTI